ncbi:ABC transporter permease [Konateibacter massiliensis]|uniref:ABC transporter permease n=1 Tax=Konateibacter massiliensis TaxID=2002841 RepID=UPI0015D4CCDA|nr:ABC-2 family transporter protein [Konateibacter massiliensis]
MFKLNIRSYVPFAVSEMKSFMSYRMAFFIYLLSEFFMMMVTYFLWRAIYQSSASPTLGGFSFEEMTSYVLVGFFTSGIVFSVPTMLISREVADGSIAMNLLKPISYRGRILAISIGSMISSGLMTLLPFMIIFILDGWVIWPGFERFLLYFVSVLLSFLNMFTFEFCFSILAFYTTYFFGLNMASDVIIRFFSGALIPLTFFPEAVADVFRLLPFASMSYTPIMIYLGKITGGEMYRSLAIQLVWIVIFYLLGSLLWQHAIKRLTILGG